ncbi:hypothetical protein [Streptosporangium roseum]|uniref:hypothetical protein n=1 Tax=Streptosporangium roseum TaxID=2001 RepID=UPI0009D76E55|nr:hypothetical protein [Streptosporangium roseum]
MALIHQATLRPTKLELLAAWLPGRDWHADAINGRHLEASGSTISLIGGVRSPWTRKVTATPGFPSSRPPSPDRRDSPPEGEVGASTSPSEGAVPPYR